MSDEHVASEDAQRALDRLGAVVRNALASRERSSSELATARRALVAALDRPPTARPRALAFVAAGAAAIAIGVASFALWPEAPISYEVVGSAAREHDPWMSAPDGVDLPLRFSDGSTVLLAAGARGRVAETNAHGARVEIERGRASFSIRHQKGTRWVTRAGPFELRVTGTRFDVSWDPALEVFTLVMQDGSVVLEGPHHPAQPVVAGQEIVIDLAEKPHASAAPSALPDAPAPSALASAEPATPAPTAVPQASEGRERAPSWKKLAAEGKWKDALAAAERSGFDGLCTSASAADLMALGDAARLSANGARANQAYTAARLRFSGSDEAALAAFRLGALAFPDRSASRWLEAYLRERPNGPLASEALGRILELHDRAHNDGEARATAERYLARFPSGPHAALARRVLTR